MLAGVVSSDYEPALLPGEQVERMDIHLRGGLRYRAAIRKLEALAEQANRYEALRMKTRCFTAVDERGGWILVRAGVSSEPERTGGMVHQPRIGRD